MRSLPGDLVGPIEVRTTHLSEVYLGRDAVLKVKRPVDVGFVDFRDREARRAACVEELRINQRLAPSVYLGVVELPDGEPAVRMRRLDDADSFDARLHDGRLTVADVEAAARRVAALHGASRGAEAARFAAPEVVRANVLGNFVESTAHIGVTVHPDVHARGADAAARWLAGAAPTLARRAPRAVDGHGDLRLEHVYRIGTSIVVIDGVEFSAALRMGDPLSDIAFLVMDLAVHGAPALADATFAAWSAATGDDGDGLLDGYLSYRSLVRGKVRGLQAELSERHRMLARRHWTWGVARLLPPAQRPVLVGVGGLPGTGKSTLARALGARGFRVIRSDVVRKELAGLPPDAGAAAPFGAGLYDDAHRDAVYARCFALAADALFAGERVVIDASFTADRWRSALHARAHTCGVASVLLRCEAPEDVVIERLARRKDDASDADAAVYRSTVWEAGTAAVPVDTRADAVDRAVAAIDAAAAGLNRGPAPADGAGA